MREQKRGDLINLARVHERLIALDIHDVGGLRHSPHGLRNPVGAGRVIRRGHHRLSAESNDGILDALVIGGDEDFIEPRTLLAALPNVLNQWFPRNEMKGLSGEARGAPAGRKDTKNECFRMRMRHACGRLGERRTRNYRRTRAVSENSSPGPRQEPNGPAMFSMVAVLRFPSPLISD